MGIRAWWNKLRQREDSELIQEAQEAGFETPAERTEESQSRLARGADAESARLAGETIRDAERLGDDE